MTDKYWGPYVNTDGSLKAESSMTDSRPEITVRADGAFVVLTLKRILGTFGIATKDEIPLSVEEAQALKHQLQNACDRIYLAGDFEAAGLTAIANNAKPMLKAMGAQITEEQMQAFVEHFDKQLAKAEEYMRNIPHSLEVKIEEPKSWRDRAIEEPML